MTSGIDTESIVAKMMAIERRPQDLMRTRITALQKSQTAWQAIADALTSLKTASDTLAGLDSISSLRTVTSSNTAALTARSTGPGANTSASIEIVGLAAATSILAADTFLSASDSIGARTLDITSATGATTTIASTDGTVAGLVSAVNAAGIGVTARLLQTSPGQYQLSLTSTSTGTAASFTAGGTGWTSLDTVRAATDAQIRVDGVLVTRPSNVVSDVIEGVELTLVGASAAPVTVTSGRDDAAITAKVKSLVDAANALLSGIATATRTSGDAAARGPLAGDRTARAIADQVRSAIAQGVATSSGAVTPSSALGVSLTRAGAVTFDPAKLAATLQSSPETVLAAIGRSATSTANGVAVIGATSVATQSSRTITVTQAASRATLVGMVTPPPAPGTVVSMNIVTPTGTYNVSFTAGNTWAQTAGNLNAALRAAGVNMTSVAQPGGSLDLLDDKYGAGHGFTVTGGAAVGLDGASGDGSDAAGTLDGLAFTATGRSLTSGGVVLSIATTDAQLAAAGGTVTGTVSLSTGLAGALAAIGAQGSSSGPAISSKTRLQDQIDDVQKRIARYDDTLKLREQVLRARFTSMETLIDRLQQMTVSMPGFSSAS